MSNYEILGSLLTFSALIGYFNARTFKMPTTITLMGSSLIASLLLLMIDFMTNNNWGQVLQPIMQKIDFRHFLLNGILNLLLFAGAINIDLNDLYDSRYEISLLALGSTLVSAALIAVSVYTMAPIFSISMPWVYCFLLGAIISPTDPIAVLALFKKLGVSTKLDTTVSGESLFNDGVAIVLFTTLLLILTGDTQFDAIETVSLFFQLAFGGIIYGTLLGLLGFRLIASIDNPKVEILITLAIATGGYYLADVFHVSGPLAMVCAGIFIGNQGKLFSVKKETKMMLDLFWEMIDEILNAILFFLIGAELLIIPFNKEAIALGVFLLPIFIFIRALTVYMPLTALKTKYPPYFKRIVIWGGLRGGLAIALALSLPENSFRDIILIVTYIKVIFSILIQGSTMPYLVKKL